MNEDRRRDSCARRPENTPKTGKTTARNGHCKPKIAPKAAFRTPILKNVG